MSLQFHLTLFSPPQTTPEPAPLLAFRATADGTGRIETHYRSVPCKLHLPWVELKHRVTRQQLPVMVIEEAMRRYSHDQPERKGSELNDTHRVCLAPYVDQTFVDKRNLESARRARSKSPMFDRLVIGVRHASNCAELASALTAQSRPL